MEEEPSQPPPSDLSDAATPQPTAAESGEEKPQSVPQCEEVDGRQSIQSIDESETEEPDRPIEESAVPSPQCSQSDDRGERRSAADEEEREEYMPAVEVEEKPQVDGSDERLSSLREEKLVEEVEKASPLKEEEEEEEEEEKVLTSEPGAAVDEFMQEYVEEKISDVAGPCPTEELDGERPQLAERNEKVYSLKEEEEEEQASISETAVDEVMPENLEEKLHQTEELNGERHQSAEGGRQGCSLQQALLENDENSSSSEEGLYGKEEEKIPVSDDIMQEIVEEKLPDFGGMQPAEQLDENMPQSTEKDEKVSSLQEEYVGEEEKVPLSQLSVSIADVDEIMHENVEGKLSEEQLNEEKPQSVRKGKKMSSSRRGLEEEDEKVSSLQEKYAEKDEKVSTVQEESDDKEESDEKEEAEEMDMDEGGPAMAAGRRTGSKRKRGRPPVAQGRKARAPPKPKEEEEELCFICFDGGDLVVCDHR